MPRIRFNLNYRIVDPAEIFTARVFSNDSLRLEYVTGIENKKKQETMIVIFYLITEAHLNSHLIIRKEQSIMQFDVC